MPHYEVYGCECCGGYTFPDVGNWGSSIYRWYKRVRSYTDGCASDEYSESFTTDSDHQGDCDHYDPDYDTVVAQCKASVAQACLPHYGFWPGGATAAENAANLERCLPGLAANKYTLDNPSACYYYTRLTFPAPVNCQGKIECLGYAVVSMVAEFTFAGIWTPPFFCIGSYDTTWTYGQHAVAGEAYGFGETPAPITYNDIDYANPQCEWATLNDNEPPCV